MLEEESANEINLIDVKDILQPEAFSLCLFVTQNFMEDYLSDSLMVNHSLYGNGKTHKQLQTPIMLDEDYILISL